MFPSEFECDLEEEEKIKLLENTTMHEETPSDYQCLGMTAVFANRYDSELSKFIHQLYKQLKYKMCV